VAPCASRYARSALAAIEATGLFGIVPSLETSQRNRYLPEEYFTAGPVTVTLDSSTLIDQNNVGRCYYGPVPLDIPLPPDALAFAQGIGFVHQPLSVGTHALKLAAALRSRTGEAPRKRGFVISIHGRFV
jgi:hypothetical protein